MAERPDDPCPLTGQQCQWNCATACLRLADGVEPSEDET